GRVGPTGRCKSSSEAKLPTVLETKTSVERHIGTIFLSAVQASAHTQAPSTRWSHRRSVNVDESIRSQGHSWQSKRQSAKTKKLYIQAIPPGHCPFAHYSCWARKDCR